jgi:hypothetical protein
MAQPMRTFVTDDGRHFLMPGDPARTQDPDEGIWCTCHKMMGNDFYFLPIDACLRKDKVCDGRTGRL